MNIWYVYIHVRLDTNEVFYVGIGKKKNYRRVNSKWNRNNFWRRVVSKTDFESYIILDNLNSENAELKEIELIQFYGRRDKGLGTLVNLTDGGFGVKGYQHTDETKKFFSELAKGRIVSEEVKLKISKGNMGIVRSDEFKENLRIINTGKKMPEWLKEKLREINTGKRYSEETKKKISESNKGKSMSLESRKKLSEARKGIIFTKEHIKKLSVKHEVCVLQYDLEGNFIKDWNSIKEVCQELNVNRSKITRSLRRNSIVDKKFIFKYKNEKDKVCKSKSLLEYKSKEYIIQQFCLETNKLLNEFYSFRKVNEYLKLRERNQSLWKRLKINQEYQYKKFLWKKIEI